MLFRADLVESRLQVVGLRGLPLKRCSFARLLGVGDSTVLVSGAFMSCASRVQGEQQEECDASACCAVCWRFASCMRDGVRLHSMGWIRVSRGCISTSVDECVLAHVVARSRGGWRMRCLRGWRQSA